MVQVSPAQPPAAFTAARDALLSHCANAVVCDLRCKRPAAPPLACQNDTQWKTGGLGGAARPTQPCFLPRHATASTAARRANRGYRPSASKLNALAARTQAATWKIGA